MYKTAPQELLLPAVLSLYGGLLCLVSLLSDKGVDCVMYAVGYVR